jgi:hypothetical protein
MMRILMGLTVGVVVAAAGFFGFEFYTQHRIANEVDAAFELIRATGGTASHGKISFGLWSRNLEIADIAAESAAQPPLSIKIARLRAAGVRRPDAMRFTADTIEATDIDVDAGLATPAVFRMTYKLPRIAVKDYSGPATLPPMPTTAAAIDIYRFAIKQSTDIAASSVTAPSVALTIDGGAAISAGYIYSNLALRDIKDGKVASLKVDRVAITAAMQPVGLQQAGKVQKYTGELANLAIYDFDQTAAATILDPAKANDDHYYRVYRQMTAGPYTIDFDQGPRMRMDTITIDDVGVRPSRLQFATLMSILQTSAKSTMLPPAQARELMARVASIYEGVRIGNAEAHGGSFDTPQGSGKLATMRMNLENGKFGEFAIEGLDATAAKGPIRLERFALKSLDISGLIRISAQVAGQQPTVGQALALLPLIEGAELKGFIAPSGNTDKPIRIDRFGLNWGQFVGSIPSKAHLAVKMSSPLDTTDPRQKTLVAAGLDRAAIDLDLGAGWKETSATFALEPMTLEIGGLLKASARVSLANMTEAIFSSNPARAMTAAAQLEAGTIELSLRDTGGIDLAVAQYAQSQNVSRETARNAMADSIKAIGEKATAANPDAAAAVEALTRFVETTGQALIIKLTPLGKVPAVQVAQLLKTDPFVALAQFKIEASTGL